MSEQYSEEAPKCEYYHPSTPTEGIPVHPESQDALLPDDPCLTAEDGSKVAVSRIRDKIRWSGMFILPTWIAASPYWKLTCHMNRLGDTVHWPSFGQWTKIFHTWSGTKVNPSHGERMTLKTGVGVGVNNRWMWSTGPPNAVFIHLKTSIASQKHHKVTILDRPRTWLGFILGILDELTCTHILFSIVMLLIDVKNTCLDCWTCSCSVCHHLNITRLFC